MEHPEEVVVVACEGDQLVVWQRLAREPYEQAVLRNRRRSDESGQSGERTPKAWYGLSVEPPQLTATLSPILAADGVDSPVDILERCFVESGLVDGAFSEVDNPARSRSAINIKPVGCGPQNVGVGAPIRVGCRKHSAGHLVRDIEGSNFVGALECDARVLTESACPRQIQPGGQVGVDGGDPVTVQRPFGLRAVIEPDD